MAKETKKNVQDVEVKIEGEQWNKALDKSFEKNVQNAKIDGFRKGKCPRNIFEKKYGKESLYSDAINFIIDVAYSEALKKSKLAPIIEPKMDIKEINENGVTFIFTITTRPEVNISKYKDLCVKKEEVKVSKKEVDEEISHILEKYSDLAIKEGKAEKGDIVVIDFEGFIDEKPFEGGKGENYELTLGSNTFIPGFEEQLIGKKSEDKVEVKVTFPEDYHAENLKGKEAIFKVTVHEVKTKELPEINKELFLDLGLDDVKDEKEFRDLIKKQLEVSKENEINIKYENDVLEAVRKNTKVDIPEELVHEEIHRMMHEYEENLKMQGVSLNMFYQLTGSNEAALHDQMHDEAEKRVTYRFILEEVINKEKIKATDTEANKEAEEIAKKYNITKEDVIKEYGGLEIIKLDLQFKKALDIMKN